MFRSRDEDLSKVEKCKQHDVRVAKVLTIRFGAWKTLKGSVLYRKKTCTHNWRDCVGFTQLQRSAMSRAQRSTDWNKNDWNSETMAFAILSWLYVQCCCASHDNLDAQGTREQRRQCHHTKYSFQIDFFSSVSSRCDSYGRWILTVSYFQASPFFFLFLNCVNISRAWTRTSNGTKSGFSIFLFQPNQLIYVPHFHNYAIGCYKSECGIRRP